MKKLSYTNKSRLFTLRRNIYFNQNINILKIFSLLVLIRNFLFFKTRFKEIETKPDLENKINSNIDHMPYPVFLFSFKVPPRGLLWKMLLFWGEKHARLWLLHGWQKKAIVSNWLLVCHWVLSRVIYWHQHGLKKFV